jgi:2-C-methyl-D-erythritol 2,4-cyclodiphosphate synthase
VKYKDISSMKLLSRVKEIVEENGRRIGNIDATVVAENPRLSPYIDEMKKKMARTLGISPEQVGIKATSSEGMGFTGRGEGIAAMAVALLEDQTDL